MLSNGEDYVVDYIMLPTCLKNYKTSSKSLFLGEVFHFLVSGALLHFFIKVFIWCGSSE